MAWHKTSTPSRCSPACPSWMRCGLAALYVVIYHVMAMTDPDLAVLAALLPFVDGRSPVSPCSSS